MLQAEGKRKILVHDNIPLAISPDHPSEVDQSAEDEENSENNDDDNITSATSPQPHLVPAPPAAQSDARQVGLGQHSL